MTGYFANLSRYACITAKVAAVGFMIFGCGVEMAGITVSRGIVKWFKGREMALAMGSEMALARLGVATRMIFSPFFAKLGGQVDVALCGIRCSAFDDCAHYVYCLLFHGQKNWTNKPAKLKKQKNHSKLKTSATYFQAVFLVSGTALRNFINGYFPLIPKYAVNMLQCNLTFTAPETGSFW